MLASILLKCTFNNNDNKNVILYNINKVIKSHKSLLKNILSELYLPHILNIQLFESNRFRLTKDYS